MKKTPKRKRSYRKVRIELTPAQLRKITAGLTIEEGTRNVLGSR